MSKDRVAIVTGAAQGIGLAIAERLAVQGIRVALTDVNLAEANKQAQALRSAGLEAQAFSGDVGDVAAIGEMLRQAAEHFGHLDILVNNAGILFSNPVTAITEEEWDLVMKVNLKGAFFCMQKALPYLTGRPHARIINIASVAGQMGSYASGMAYVASKGGMLSMTYGMSRQLAPLGITVNAVCPGTIETDIIKQWTPEKVAELTGRIPLGHLGKAEDIAAAVAFLAQEDTDFITGEAMSVNGGMYCG